MRIHLRLFSSIAVILSLIRIGYLWLLHKPILDYHWGILVIFGIVALIIFYFTEDP